MVSRISLSSFWIRLLIGAVALLALWIVYTRLLAGDQASVGSKEVRANCWKLKKEKRIASLVIVFILSDVMKLREYFQNLDHFGTEIN